MRSAHKVCCYVNENCISGEQVSVTHPDQYVCVCVCVCITRDQCTLCGRRFRAFSRRMSLVHVSPGTCKVVQKGNVPREMHKGHVIRRA